VLWSPQSGPICGYEDPTLARDHAALMLGVEVSRVELRDELPDIAVESEVTPVALEDIEDDDHQPD
jgi:hypothetical protein